MLRDARSADPLLTHHDDDNDRGRPSYRSPSRRTSPLPSRSHLSTTTKTTTTTARAYVAPVSTSPPPTSPRGLSARPAFARRSPAAAAAAATTTTMRSRSPALTTAAAAGAEARRRYTYAAFFLVVCLVSFTVQTMLASEIQHERGWDKAYCMLYLTHGSWVLLWPLQLAVLWVRRSPPEQSWRRFWDGHVRTLRAIALVVETRDVKAAAAVTTVRESAVYGQLGGGVGGGSGGGLLEYGHSPVKYLGKATAVITSALTVAGLSWYLAVSMTTPSDLTAIYNCSAFFAYAFSVPLLKERLRADKMLAVAVAIVGVLVVAYGDGADGGPEESSSSSSAASPGGADASNGGVVDPAARFAGNLIIGAGSVLYGLYEVLYKRFACPPEGMDATRGVIFANTFGSLMGAFTLLVLWIPLPVLHVLGWEKFEVPTGETAWLLFISVIMNMMFSGSFLVLISLTSPVLSSVASLLTIFMVAIVDWFVTGTPLSGAAVLGGLLIVAAFVILSWSTWREMNEEERRKQIDLSSGDED
ncbi:hypothetical protein L209DRAFT_748952, partial [Thermothelomyces heterothallicus CBS 203.75]